MLDMTLFRNPAFSAGSAGMILIFLAMFGVMFLITQYFQLILGYSALGASLRFLPMSPIMVLVATRTPKLAARFGAHRTVATGMTLVARRLIMFRGLDVDTSYLYVFACIVPLTPGIAMAMSPMTASIMSAVPACRAGTGSASERRAPGCRWRARCAVLASAASRYAHSLINRVIDTVLVDFASRRAASLPSALESAKSMSTVDATAVIRRRTCSSRASTSRSRSLRRWRDRCVVVYRYLPHVATHETAVESAEHMAELGAGGHASRVRA
jgi:hypothetical protein